jgi:hypothetical protein
MIAVTTFVCSSAQLTSSFRRIRGTHCFTDTSQTNRNRKEEEQVPQSNLVSVNGGFVKKKASQTFDTEGTKRDSSGAENQLRIKKKLLWQKARTKTPILILFSLLHIRPRPHLGCASHAYYDSWNNAVGSWNIGG